MKNSVQRATRKKEEGKKKKEGIKNAACHWLLTNFWAKLYICNAIYVLVGTYTTV